MSKYTKYDFMPNTGDQSADVNADLVRDVDESSEASETDAAMREPMKPLDLSPEQMEVDGSSQEPIAEIGIPVPRNGVLGWAKITSGIFSPLLIPVYCVALAMWITPLSHVPEKARLGVTLVVLLLTTVAPMSYVLAMLRLGRIRHLDMRERKHRIAPAVIIVAGLILSAVYLYRVYAPVWLVMIPVSGAVSALAYFVVNFFTLVSGHAMGMGMLTAVVYYLGASGLADVAVTPWVMAMVLLSGFVCSARLALERHTVADVTIGYVVGAAVAYVVMHIHLFEPLAVIV